MNIKFKTIIHIFITCTFLLISTANSQDLAQKINNLLQSLHDNHLFDGTALVAEGDNIIYTGAFGEADRDWAIANTVDSKFWVASVSKQFTSMMILQLVAQGKIDLQARVSTYLPFFQPENGEKITIHHLLSHSSGLPHYGGFEAIDVNIEEYMRLTTPVEEYVKVISKMHLQSEPGTTYSYSSMGYVTLGLIIEKVSGLTFGEALQKFICLPLNLKNTGFESSTTITPKLAKGYEFLFKKLPNGKPFLGYFKEPYRDQSNKYSTGGIHSTVEDLFSWTRALWTNKILEEKYRTMMFTPQSGTYGYGWDINTIQVGEKMVDVIQHTGGLAGYRSIVSMSNKGAQTIILLSNLNLTQVRAIRQDILMLMAGLNPGPAIDGALLVAEKMLTDGVEEGSKLHDSLIRQDKKYTFAEGNYNNYGYQLAGIGRLQEAIRLFEHAIKTYPQAANLYDSLAEAHMNNGDTSKALMLYTKALSIARQNPDKNKNVIESATRMLQKLENK